MNYSKLKEKFKKEISNKQEFFASIGMSSSGFYQMLKDETLKVKVLEAISDALNLSPAYWWEGEEGAVHYGGYIPRSVYLDMLSKWNEDRESKKKLEEHIDFLQKHFDDHKRKNAHCG